MKFCDDNPNCGIWYTTAETTSQFTFANSESTKCQQKSFTLGDALEPPSLTDSTLDRIAYDICQMGRCTIAQMTRLCSALPGQQVAKRRKRCTSDGETGRQQHTFSVGAFAAGGTVGVQNNTRLYPWATRLVHRHGAWRVPCSSLFQLLSVGKCYALQAQRSRKCGAHHEPLDSLQPLAWGTDLGGG